MEIVIYKRSRSFNLEKTDAIKTEALFDKHGKKLVNFVVLQLYYGNNNTYQIKKHDFSHGIYNIHNYYEKLNHKQEFPEEPLSNELFWRCKQDIKENWFYYRERYRKKHLQI